MALSHWASGINIWSLSREKHWCFFLIKLEYNMINVFFFFQWFDLVWELQTSMCSFIDLMPSVIIYNVNGQENKVNSLNDKMCSNFWSVVIITLVLCNVALVSNDRGQTVPVILDQIYTQFI